MDLENGKDADKKSILTVDREENSNCSFDPYQFGNLRLGRVWHARIFSISATILFSLIFLILIFVHMTR